MTLAPESKIASRTSHSFPPLLWSGRRNYLLFSINVVKGIAVGAQDHEALHPRVPQVQTWRRPHCSSPASTVAPRRAETPALRVLLWPHHATVPAPGSSSELHQLEPRSQESKSTSSGPSTSAAEESADQEPWGSHCEIVLLRSSYISS